MSPYERVDRILAAARIVGSDLTSWEKFEFLPNLRFRSSLTEKQEKILREIELRILGEIPDDE